MALWVTPQGTARPEEVLALLGLDDLLADGAVLHRTTVELDDEIPSGTQPVASRPLPAPADMACPGPGGDLPTAACRPWTADS